MKKSSITPLSIVITILLIVGTLTILQLHVHCPIYVNTGIPCPGCGITKALHSIMRFDFIAAWRYNPLCFVLPFLLVFVLFNGKPFKNNKVNNILIIIFIGVAILSYGYKLLSHFVL